MQQPPSLPPVTAGLGTQIYSNQLKSAVLLAGFPFLLVLMVGGFFFGLDALTQSGQSWHGMRQNRGVGNVYSAAPTDWHHALQAGLNGIQHEGLYAILAALIWFVIAYFFHARMVRAATGSVPITREQMPRIYNMLENLCISRGLPMPQFEIIDSPALNAFATGIDNDSYKIVLTRGIIEKLSDDELEAVIGHELTHIMNRDVRLLIISVIFVGMISFMAQIIFRMLVYGGRPNYYRSRSRDDNKNGNAFAIMLIALAVLAIGWLFAVVIRFALSRKREYLADAGSIDLTRNPEAMMRALMRIAGHDEVQGMSQDFQQMCIENSHNFMGIFATHPSIDDRINTISRMTGTPIPTLPVTLRRAPDSPWQGGKPPASPTAGPWN